VRFDVFELSCSGIVKNIFLKGLGAGSFGCLAAFSVSRSHRRLATVILATKIGFPISTTHGLTGVLVGAGIPTTLKPADVKDIKTSASTLMGPHLLDALTMEQFADVISYLHSLK
jgi:PiT family inorganic phosphate transporter